MPSIDLNYWRSRLASLAVHSASAGVECDLGPLSLKILNVRGIEIDHIETVSESKFQVENYEAHIALLREWYDFSRDGRVDSFVSEQIPFDERFCTTMLGGCAVDEFGMLRKARLADVDEWRKVISLMIMCPGSDEPVFHSSIMETHMAAVIERKLFRTAGGRLGVGPALSRPGDVVWILAGGKHSHCWRHMRQCANA